VSAIWILGTAVSSILAAVILDALMHRPEGGGSVTTVIPGFVYSIATVMKVCLVSGVLSAGIAVLGLATGGGSGARGRITGLPVWGIASVALTASTPLLGSCAVILAQALTTGPAGLSISGMSTVSRIAVFITLALLSSAALLAMASLVKRERPGLLPVMSLVVNALLIGLFWHFEFYALGFDQDTWAPR
jgi:hypothetical protein